ncbi:MAG: sulfate ABC transporter ATP-binding protein [Luteolibacter sp.]|jgi:sulfate transport system ATP-binding protein|nr:sulfate ABC transporter ATP-binding protein [Luteolibacter sp.]
MSISIHSINKTFGSYKALEDVSLEVPNGSLTALLGPSGSGKTTLLRIVAGLEFADDGPGKILFHGENVVGIPAGKRSVGFVFQHYALFRHMSVADNIAFGLTVLPRSKRPAKSEIRDRVHELLGLVKLDGLDKRRPHELSGGQRQRVALARALAIRPKVLLLDEPFGALDAKVRKDLRRWLRVFHDEINLTTLFVTHDQEEALELADQVVVMRNARIEQVGTPQEIYDRPRSPFVYEFLGNVNKLTEPNGVQRYIRPHEIEVLFAAEYDPTTDRMAKIQHLFSAGPVATLGVRLDDGKFVDVELSRKQLEDLGLSVGDEVAIRSNPPE